MLNHWVWIWLLFSFAGVSIAVGNDSQMDNLNNIDRTDSSKAIAILRQAETTYQANNSFSGLIQVYRIWSEILLLYEDVEKSHLMVRRGIQLFESKPNKDSTNYFKLRNVKGEIYFLKGITAEALQIHHEALKYFKRKMSEKEIAHTLLRIAIPNDFTGKHDEAHKYYGEAIKYYDKLKDIAAKARCIRNIGGMYCDDGIIEKGMPQYEIAIQLFDSIGALNQLSITYSNYGYTYQMIGQPQKAIYYYEMALKIAEKTKSKTNIAFAHQNMSDFYFVVEDFKKARMHGSLSLKLGRELKNYQLCINNIQVLYDIEIEEENYEAATYLGEELLMLNDSIYNLESARVVNELQEKYKANERDQEILLLLEQDRAKQSEIQRKNMLNYAAFGGISLLLIIVFIVVRNLKINKLKNQIISEKKEEVERQKLEIEYKNKNLTDSIVYAKRIQKAILPDQVQIAKNGSSFIFFRPKDIVSGDFYWIERAKDQNVIYFAACDCTGHGVPGALVSVVCSNALTKVIKEMNITTPGDILDHVNTIIEAQLSSTDDGVMDGMDLALCKLDIAANSLEYAGANNPLWIIRDKSMKEGTSYGIIHQSDVNQDKILVEIKADKQPIGRYDNRKPYTNHVVQLTASDSIYIFSDGFPDQFGGKKGKKFKYRPFKDLLLSIQNHSMEDQHLKIEQSFDDWKGALEQIDDVCVIGVRV